MVTATLSPAGCDQSTAYQTVACVQMQGSDGPEQCDQQSGVLTARVFYQPYRPGATYIATGEVRHHQEILRSPSASRWGR